MTEIIISGVFMMALFGYIFKVNKNGEDKRAHIYDRMNMINEDNENKYVDVKVCNIKHEYVIKKLDEVSLDVKKLLTKNGLN